ncbi:MAG: tetratricopeptide repeat protein [Phycisphaerae bacterium]|nr:tetratricopeptide repeat protein [Phycisphaerae bacterium]
MIRWIPLILIACVLLCATLGIGAEKLSVAARESKMMREAFAPPEMDDAEARRMRDLVAKLNAMSLPASRQARPAKAHVEPEPESEPVKAAVPTPKPAPAKPTISPEVLKQLQTTLPEAVSDPMRLADTLLASGHRQEALVFYKYCYERTQDTRHRSWLLYQMAQCQMVHKPSEARKLLRQLISEYPDSRWSQLAAVHVSVLEWMEENRPQKFLADVGKELDGMMESKGSMTPRTGKRSVGSRQARPAAKKAAKPVAKKRDKGK